MSSTTDLVQLFRDHDAEEARNGAAYDLSLKPGERIKVRYFKEPVPVYDLRDEEMTYGHARTEFAVADKDAGKGALLETLAEGHLQRGNHVIELHGSVDNESMALARSDWVIGRNVCIVHGPTVEIDQSGAKRQFDVKDVNKMTFADYDNYDILLSSPRFFMDENGMRDYTSIGKFLRRLLIHRESSKPIIYTLIREASEIIYSRIKADERQDEVKAQVMSLLGQARHIGIALALDTQRAVNVDKAFRELADHTFFKRPRGENLPEEKQFAYRYIDLNPMLVMPQNRFAVVDTVGVGEGINYMPKWHKKEDDVILAQLGIISRFVQAPVEGEDRGDYNTLGDKEHVEMVMLYMDGDGTRPPYSQNEIADAKGLSTATPNYHFKKHNEEVKEHGECQRCARAKGKYAKQQIGRGP